MTVLGKNVAFTITEDNPEYRYGDLNRPPSLVTHLVGTVEAITASEKTVYAVINCSNKLIQAPVNDLEITNLEHIKYHYYVADSMFKRCDHGETEFELKITVNGNSTTLYVSAYDKQSAERKAVDIVEKFIKELVE